jgi:hypothetical protein
MFEQIGGMALGAVSGWFALGLDMRASSNSERLWPAIAMGTVTVAGVALVASLGVAAAAGIGVALSSLAGAGARATLARRTARRS